MTDQELRDRIREAHEREARHPHHVDRELDFAASRQVILVCACGRHLEGRTRGLAIRSWRSHREREERLTIARLRRFFEANTAAVSVVLDDGRTITREEVVEEA